MTNVQNKVQAAFENGTTAVEVKNALAGKRLHFIGAGGVGMSGLAQLLLKNDAIVSGSDEMKSGAVENLIQAGADINLGHKTENLDADTDAVVISAAIRQDNPELQQAISRGCKVYKYAEMLGLLMGNYEGIAICGTHGKSTTTGWLVYSLKQLGVDVNFIVGAGISQLGCSSGAGDSEYFAAEACEYDRSFLNLKPAIGCILNIEQDHLDYYRNEQEIVAAFAEFAAGVKEGGVVIANAEDSNVTEAIKELPPSVRCETFGFGKNCTYSAQNIKLENGLYSFEVYHNGQPLGSTRIALPGVHNVLNALAVTAVIYNLGLEPEKTFEVLGDFTGIERRMEFKGEFDGIKVLDDYAHHPTEIRASLEAIRQRYEPRRLWCVFQPHQYSRTRFLLDDFSKSFKLADVTIMPEIYFVRDSENSKKQINASILVQRIRGNGSDALFIDSFSGISEYLVKNVKAGDVVVTMGAGDIWKVADEYIQRLRENS